MRYLNYLLWPVKFILFAILFGFAMHNAGNVTLNFFLGYSWNAPLALLLLIFFVLGAAFGSLACLARVARARRELVALRKEVRQYQAVNKPVVIDTPHDVL